MALIDALDFALRFDRSYAKERETCGIQRLNRIRLNSGRNRGPLSCLQVCFPVGHEDTVPGETRRRTGGCGKALRVKSDHGGPKKAGHWDRFISSAMPS